MRLKQVFDRGRILYPRQWYLGFCAMLDQLQQQLAECGTHRLMNQLLDIALMFDKVRCHELFTRHQVPVPKTLGLVRSFDQLMTRMQEMGHQRVFIKLAHGSSASGVVAFATNGLHLQAITTVELVLANGEVQLYNSRQISRYRNLQAIAKIVDTLCRERVQVEVWVPKAGLDDHAFDLRVLVIAGQAKHVVVRLSKSPITKNLHLKNKRSDPTALMAKMGPEAWSTALQTCQQAASIFPDSLYTGVDLLIPPGYRRPVVLEVNAFGDLLPDTT